MGSDVRFQLKVAVDTKALTPVTVSDELKTAFLRKVRLYPLKYLPFSMIAFAVVFQLLIWIRLYHEKYFMIVMAFGVVIILASLISPFFLVYTLIANSIAVIRKDYDFYEGEIICETDKGYEIKGLQGHAAHPLVGRDNYDAGEIVIVARISRDFYLISE